MWESQTQAQTGRLMVLFGIGLFLAGMLTGFVIPLFENPRVGLSSHLEGVMNGGFLVALGAAWPMMGLKGRIERVAFSLVLTGTVANWIATMLAAFWGTGAMMPIAAAGRSGTPIQETIVSLMLIGLSLAMVSACLLILWQSRRPTGEPARLQAQPR